MCSQVHPQQNWERLFIDHLLIIDHDHLCYEETLKHETNRSLHYCHVDQVVIVPVRCDYCSHRTVFICYNS